MKTLKLFALALAVAGMIGTEVNAGGRRSRGCSGGSCSTGTTYSSEGSTVSTCSGGTCGQVVATTSTTQAAPATTPANKETSTVTTSAPVATSSCANGTCSTGNSYSGRGRHGR